jgi:hypothetical protein
MARHPQRGHEYREKRIVLAGGRIEHSAGPQTFEIFHDFLEKKL